MVQREAPCLNPFCAIRSLITTSNSVIVSLVVEDSAINLIRFASFVSSGTHVWETFGETIGETIGEMIGAMIGEMIGEMIRIVSTDATNAVSVN
jgi:hypothetical protein